MQATGIHDHDTLKLGLQPPKNAPAIKLGDILTGQTPDHPIAADHFGSFPFGMYENDRFGVCGPTAVANLLRLVSVALLGVEIQPSQDNVFDLYRRSGNPDFDPNTGAGDRGVDMQTMLEALLRGGIGDGMGHVIRPRAFAKVAFNNDQELDAAVSIFGGILWGVNLETPQQAQSEATPPKWDFDPTGDEWGGHAVVNGKYDESAGDDEVVSWQKIIATTPQFRREQLQQAWVVIWQANVDHPAFQQGVDIWALKSAFKELTGQDLPV